MILTCLLLAGQLGSSVEAAAPEWESTPAFSKSLTKYKAALTKLREQPFRPTHVDTEASSATAATARKTFSIGPENKFWLDGKPLHIHAGAMHYWRVPKPYWKDRLLRLKAMGLNTVETYVPWLYADPDGEGWPLTGRRDDHLEFLDVAASLGLFVVLRPAPYICAEFDFGGIPPRLRLQGPLRTYDMRYDFADVAGVSTHSGGTVLVFLRRSVNSQRLW